MIATVFWMITLTESAPDETSKSEEDCKWKGYSIILHMLLPIAGVALLWGQRGLFSKLLLQLDRSCISVYCPSFSTTEKLLKWAGGRLPAAWSSQARTLSGGIPELWKDGSLLCTLINSVVPGACSNPHRHWRKPPLHAQALAYKYLGLVPRFTEEELSGELTINQERNFIQYLLKLQETINKWSKDEANHKFSSQYVARGMGLYTGEQCRKTLFYVYSSPISKNSSNMLMHIRGPYGTQGKATFSPSYSRKTTAVVNKPPDQLEDTSEFAFQNLKRESLLRKISLSLMKYKAGERDDEIPIQIDMEIDRAKITYIPANSGVHEINLMCDGELIRGSPYSVQIVKNISGRQDEFNTDCDVVERKYLVTRRRVLSHVIDCIDEKIIVENDDVSKMQRTYDSYHYLAKNDIKNNFTLENIAEEISLIQHKTDADFNKSKDTTREVTNCTIKDDQNEIEKHRHTIIDKLHSQPSVAKDFDKVKRFTDQTVHIRSEDGSICDNVDNAEIKAEVSQASIEKINSERQDNKFSANAFHEHIQNDNEQKEEITKSNNVSTTKNSDVLDNPVSNVIVTLVQTKYISNNDRKRSLEKTLTPEELNRGKDLLEQDENNNSPKTMCTAKDKSDNKDNTICARNISEKAYPHLGLNRYDVTSSVCPDHIDPEVEINNLNHLRLSQRRKTLTKQNTIHTSDDNFSFSLSENGDLTKSDDSVSKDWIVSEFLNKPRQCNGDKTSKSHSLTSTNSLPNMPVLETNKDLQGIFKERRNYWERLSSSSSIMSLTNSDCGRSKNNILPQKNIGNSVSNIDAFTKSVQYGSPSAYNKITPYHSMDMSLEGGSVSSLDERKKQLLRQIYEEENLPPKKVNVKITFLEQKNKTKIETNHIFFAPVSDRIRHFDGSSNMQPQPENTDYYEKPKTASGQSRIKSQFKRAIKFFKNLEETARRKTRHRESKRRHSLDSQKKSNGGIKHGGSLILSNVSEYFDFNKLYKDVGGSTNGNSKVTASKMGASNCLNFFSKNSVSDELKDNESESIRNNLFVNKAKTKKRKSIK